MSRGAWAGVAGGGALIALVAVYSLSGKPAPSPPALQPGETSLAKVLKATKEAPPASEAVVPGAGKVTIEPPSPLSTEVLTARFEPAPGANSPRFQWFREGRAIEGRTETSLQPAHFRRDSYIFVRVTVDTPVGPSVVESRPVRVLNSPPTIREPAASIPAQADGAIRFQIQASDPDAEPLTFSVESSLPSVKIDPKTGWIEGKIPPGSSSFTAKVSVKDPDGLTASREITFRLPTPLQPKSGQAPPP